MASGAPSWLIFQFGSPGRSFSLTTRRFGTDAVLPWAADLGAPPDPDAFTATTTATGTAAAAAAMPRKARLEWGRELMPYRFTPASGRRRRILVTSGQRVRSVGRITEASRFRGSGAFATLASSPARSRSQECLAQPCAGPPPRARRRRDGRSRHERAGPGVAARRAGDRTVCASAVVVPDPGIAAASLADHCAGAGRPGPAGAQQDRLPARADLRR